MVETLKTMILYLPKHVTKSIEVFIIYFIIISFTSYSVFYLEQSCKENFV